MRKKMTTLIGNTPMIKINYRYQGVMGSCYTKLEYYNLSGSIKDRMVDYILTNAKQTGMLKDGMPIIEATSGNTGISIAALGARYHHPVYIFMPDWCSKERQLMMKRYGAHLTLVSKAEGGFARCIAKADALAKTLGGYRPDQFSNSDNRKAHYKSTALEIYKSLPDVTSFVSGIGTGGTLMGIGSYLKENNPRIRVVALEPDKMPMLTNGAILGQHKIEGIGDDFIPELVDQSLLDDVRLINDDDAVNMARLLAAKLGLGVGISSGANFLAAVLEQADYPGVVATVFPDDNKKYLSTSYADEINSDAAYLSNQIELLDYEIIS